MTQRRRASMIRYIAAILVPPIRLTGSMGKEHHNH
eukprot:CAMPEP_0172749262 /NCGR_PEP_ID=MMETSP1074-20121228/146952_1 /TAXON_ID=2916 /ORGANISM="Ceratium fusus, Strain PA161109" /LENGTH=34 /DNA_ID= /DNA_START= /DNA_END= /DNA_ORIENTATION=